MRAQTTRKRIELLIRIAQWTISITIALCGGVSKANAEFFGPVPGIKVAVIFLQTYAWLVAIVGPIMLVVFEVLRKEYGNPWAWDTMQKLLNEFREEVFEHKKGEPVHYHRVTLFKYHSHAVGWSNPTGWFKTLVAVARSDHLAKHRIHRFNTPDDGDKCQGVAGHAWSCKDQWVHIPSQGQLPMPNSENDSAAIKAYARETKVNEKWVKARLRKKRPLAACYSALAILHNGKPWGVVVIDSRSHGAIDQTKVARFATYAKLLSPLLQRV